MGKKDVFGVVKTIELSLKCDVCDGELKATLCYVDVRADTLIVRAEPCEHCMEVVEADAKFEAQLKKEKAQ